MAILFVFIYLCSWKSKKQLWRASEKQPLRRSSSVMKYQVVKAEEQHKVLDQGCFSESGYPLLLTKNAFCYRLRPH